MKTGTIRRPLFVTLTLLTLVALMLSIAAPALADPSPWTQTSSSHFDDGTTSNTEVVTGGSGDSGAVQLDTITDQWQVNTAGEWGDWQSASNVTTPGDYLALNRYYAWESSPSYSDNATRSTTNTSWTTLKTLNVDVTDVRNLRITVRFSGGSYWWFGTRYTTGYIRVLVNGNQVFYDSRYGTSWETDTFDTNVAAWSGTIPVQVQMYTSYWRGSARNSTFEIRRERHVYHHSGNAVHQYDAGHQVDWTSCSHSANVPGGTGVTYEYCTSDNGSTWSGWTTNCGALASSQYLQQRVSLSGTDTATPYVYWTRVNYQYYHASGTFTSSTRDPLANNGTAVAEWGNISWTENAPAGTDISVQFATSPDLSTWHYSTYGSPGAIDNFTHRNDRYMRYIVTFSTGSATQASTPRLDDVTITYNQEPYAPTPGNPLGDINDPTPTFYWSAPSDPDGDTDFRYHLQVDNNSDFSSREVDVTNINALNYTSGVLADGTYWWRVRARDFLHQGAGFSDPYGAWSNPRQFRIDSQEPDSSVTTSGAYGQAARPWPGQIDGTAWDNAGGVGLNLVEVLVHDTTANTYWNSSAWVGSPPSNWPDATGLETWALPLAVGNLTDGHEYEVDSKATDDVGNEQSVYGHSTFSFDRSIGVGDLVWHDANGDGDRDAGETGLFGVELTLNNGADTINTTTDGNGYYYFDGAAQSPVWTAGTYTVTVDESTLPAGYQLTSDPDYPLALTLVNGEKYDTADFGFGNFAIIEGYVWDDNGAGSGTARDGVRDSGEPGLPDITVSLDGSTIPDEVTGSDGKYRFKGVSAGSYSVNPDENDSDMPDYYVATSPDPLGVSGVELGAVYSDRNVGYAIPPAVDKQLYLRFSSGNRILSREPSAGPGSPFTVGTTQLTWPLASSVIGDIGLDTSQNGIVHVYVPAGGASGVMQVAIRDGATVIGTGSASVTGAAWNDIPVTFTGNTIHNGNSVVLVTSRSSGSDFDIRVDGADTYRAYVQLPVLSYVKITSLGAYDAAYPGGASTADFETGDTVYVRATATDPFGEYDITGASITIPGVVTGGDMGIAVHRSSDTAIFEYAYTNATEGDYDPVQVTVDEGSEGTVEATAETSFRVQSADVYIEKDADVVTVQSEDTIQFTLGYGNEGDIAAENVVVTDTLPAGLTYSGMVQGSAPTQNGQELVWNLGTLGASGADDGDLIFEATVDITGAETHTFVNQAEIDTTTGETDTSDNDDDASVDLDQSADLTVEKTALDVNGGDLQPGDTLRYTIVIRNHDYADATNGTLTDNIDTDTTFVPGSVVITPPGAGTAGTPPSLVTALTIPGKGASAYGEVTVQFDVTVNTPLPNNEDIVNTASVNTDQAGPVQDSVTVYVSSDHALGISKEPSANPAMAGSTLVYTITWTVTGDEPAPNVVIEDTYPTNSTYVGCGGASCSESGGDVTWNLGSIDPDDSGEVYITVTVNSPQADHTPLNNHVEISDDDGEFAQFDFSGFVGSGHTLSIVKIGTPKPVDAGGLLTYDLAYSVSGNENAQGVFITDTIPTNTTFWSCTGGCQSPGVGNTGVVTWSIGNVNVGSGGSRELVVRVASLLPQGTEIQNTAHISDTNGGAASFGADDTLVSVWHSYTISKDDDPADVVEAGDLLTYTIDWEIDNTSTEPVTGIFIEDTTPAHTTFHSCSDGCANPGVGVNGLVRWDIGDYGPGDSGTVQLVVRVDTPLENNLNLHNEATIDDDDGDSAETSPDQTTTVHSDHTLEIEKSDAPDPVEAGSVIVYTITATVPAASNAIAPTVVITDTIPAHTTFEDASTGYLYANGDVRWALGDLWPGDTRVVTFSVRVGDPLMNNTIVNNVAHVADSDGKSADSGTVQTTVSADHELWIEKTAQGDVDEDEATAVYGYIDYTIDYGVLASGNEPAPGVVITDVVPAGAAFASCSDSCTGPDLDGVITWLIGDLVPGNAGWVTFHVTLPDPLADGTTIHNVAYVADSDGETAQDDADVEIRSNHDLTIGKSDSPDPVDAGDLLYYTISYGVPAADNEPAPNVVIEDVVPLYTSFHSCSDGCANPGVGGAGMVSWDLGTLMPDDSGSVQLVVRVDSPMDNGDDVFNSATISDDDGETASIQDIRTLVHSGHSLSVSKSDAGYDPVDAGDPLVYTIVYTVAGNESSYGATLADNIPANTTYVGCSGGVLCSQSGNQVTWILNQLNPDPVSQVVTGTAYLILEVNSPLPHETIINNTVRFFDNTTPLVTDSEDTTVHSDYSYTIEKSAADEVESGDELEYSIDWSIDGNRPVGGVTISDTVPANTIFVSCSGGDSCGQSGGVVTWNLSDPLYPPDAGQVSFRVAVDNLLPDGVEIVNTATIQDAALSLESDPVTTTVHSDHVLSLTKLDAPDPVDAGAVLEYTLAYTVTGNQYAPNVALRDTIPDNTTFLDCAGCVGPDSSDVISWTFGTLTPPYNDSVSFRVTVTDVLPSGTSIFNFADLNDDDGKTAFAYAETTVSSHHDLTLEKSDNGYDPVQAGELLTYTIAYGVQAGGNEPAPNVTIEDATPLHTTFYTATGGIVQPNTPDQGSTGDVTWYLGELLPGDAGYVTLVVRVNDPLDDGTILHNTVDISDDDGGYATDDENTTVASSHGFDISKTGDDEVDAGDYIDYIIQFTVQGNEGADSVAITDTIPANTIFQSCGGDVSCTNYGAYVRWNFGNHDPGEGGIATLRVQTVSPLPDGTTIHNVAHIYDDNDGAPNDDDHDTLVGSGHVLSVDKSDDPDPVDAGALLNYTIDWSVAGNETAQSVVITDRVPFSTTFVSASGGVTPDGNGVLTWSLGDQAPGQNGSVNFTVRVNTPLPDGVYIYNTAYISDDNGGAASDLENTRVNANHTLEITKIDDPDPVSAGGTLTYTLNWSVSGNEPAPNVRIEDYVPANTSYGSCSGGDVCGNVGGLVTWDLGNLVPGNSGSVTLIVHVNDLLGDGTLILNQATILDDDGVSDSSAQINTTVQSTHELFVIKSDTGYDPVQAGATLVYAIDYNVTGHEVAQGVTIRDQVPANTTFDHCTGGTLCGDAGGGLITWQLGDLTPGTPGASGTVYLYLNVDSPLPNNTPIDNTAAIQDNNGGVTDLDDEETTVHSDHDLTIAKSDVGYDPVQAGAQIQYTIDYAVTGNQMAHTVVITDRIPAEASFNSCSDSCSEASGLVTWNLGDLAPGAGSVTLLVDVNSPLPNPTTLTNIAAIHDADGAGHYHETSENTTVESSHALHVTKSDDVDPVAPGGDIRYTIEWSVTGNEAATGIVISDTVPANTSFISVEDGGSHNAGLVTWDIASADPNTGGTVHFTARANDTLPNGTIIENTVEIDDANSGATDDDTELTTVASGHALHVSKIDTDDPVQAGTQIEYTINYSVTGDEQAQSVTVVDTLPDHTSFSSCSAGCGVVGDTVTWDLGNLSPGTVDSLTLVVDVDEPLPNPTTLVNEVAISDANDGATDDDTEETTVNSAHTFVLNKGGTPDPVAPDGVINYILHWEVTGNESAQTIVITDAIPADTSFESCGTCVPHLAAGYVQWTLPGLREPGDSGDVSFQVRVTTPLTDETNIHNWSRISDGNFGAPVVATSDTEVDSDHTLDIQKTGPSGAAAGDDVQYTISYHVYGDEPAPNVVISDTVPVDTSFVSADGPYSGPDANDVVTWNLGNLVPGNGGLLHMTVAVTDTLDDGTHITNTARISDDDTGTPDAEDEVITTITSGHAFSIDKTDAPDPVEAGAGLTYTITWEVFGSETAQNVVIVDQLPANVSYASSTGGGVYNGGMHQVTWDLNDQSPGASGTFVVQVNVASPLPNGAELENDVSISDDNGGIPASDDETTTVHSGHVLHVSKTGPATVDAGGQVTYNITWSITGNENAEDVLLVDTLPDNTSFSSCSGGCSDLGNTVTWDLGDQAHDAGGSFTLVVDVDSPLPNDTLLENEIGISDDNGGVTAGDSVQTTVESAHTFTLSKSDNPDPISPNGVINYIIHWEVAGNEAAQTVVITDVIPADTSYESCGACVPYAGYVVWTIPGLHDPGDNGDVSLQVRVDTPLEDETNIHNEATIADSNGGAPVVAVADTEVDSNHTLDVEKSGPSGAAAGEEIEYTISYQVSGDEPAANVVITDTVPAHTTFVSADGIYSGPDVNGVITWNLGNLDPGTPAASGELHIRVEIDDPLGNGTVLHNTARISDDDAGTAADESTVDTTVTSGHAFNIHKSDDVDPVDAGTQLLYTINWSVSGSETAQNVTVVDTLPNLSHVTFADATPGYALGAGTVTWDLGTQPPNASGVLTVVLDVDSPLPNNTLLTNQVDISDSNGGLPASDTEQTTVRSSHALDVEKVGTPDPVDAGAQLTYVITYTVTGNEVAEDVIVQDATPPNTTFANAFGGAWRETPPVNSTGLVRWHLNDLSPGATGVVTLVVNVASPLDDGTMIQNTATIADDNGGATDGDTIQTAVSSSHALHVTKTGPTDADPNTVLNYNVHWSVTGNEMAQSVVITDGIPANTTYVAGGTFMGDHVRWSLGNRNPGDSGDVSFQVRVTTPLTDNTVIENVAYISDYNGGAPDDDDALTTIHADHSLDVSKDAPDEIVAGGQIQYTIDYTVYGNEPAPDVVINDTVPENTTFQSATGSYTGPDANGVITWTLGNLNPGQGGTLYLIVLVDDILPGGTPITNTVTISDGDDGADEDTTITTVTSGHGFTLNKTDDPDPVDAGAQLDYALTWTLAGSEPAEGVTVVDTLPDHVTFLDATSGYDYDGVAGTVTWNLGDFDPPNGGALTITLQVEDVLPNGTLLTNEAEISDDNDGTPAETTEQTTVQSGHALSIEKVDDPDPVDAGTQLTYVITWTVSGNEEAQEVVIEDSTPSHTTFASAESSVPATIETPGVGNSGPVRWRLGDQLPGATEVVTLVVNVASPLDDGTIIENTVSIADDNSGTPDDAATSTEVESGHALDVEKTGPATAVPAGQINYNIHWEATGNEMAYGVVITDPIPANTSFDWCGGCIQRTGYVEWQLGDRAPGASGDLSLRLEADTPLENNTDIANTAYIFDDADVSDDSTFHTTIVADHDLTLEKTGPATVLAGEEIVYDIEYGVTGNEPAPDVVITDTVPAYTMFVDATAPYDGPDANGVITWTLGVLNPGAGDTLNLTVQTDALLADGTEITNTARIFDSDDGEAEDTFITTVSSQHGFTLDKADGQDPIQAGQQLTYTLSWSVVGSEVAENVTIVDALPDQVTYVGSVPAGVYNPGDHTITWDMGDVDPGEAGDITIIVNVDPVLPNGTQFTNEAEIGDANGGNPAQADEQTTVHSAHALDVEKSAHAATIQAGGQITYTIAWAVSGNEDAQNVVIVDNTPDDTTFAAASSSIPATIESPGVGNTGPVRYYLGNQMPGATGVVTLVVNVASPLDNGTSIANTASIVDGNSGVPDASGVTVEVESAHQLDVTKSGEGSVVAGSIIHYTIDWTVSGNESAYSVVITDHVPANTTFVNCSGGDSCNHDLVTGIVTWQLGDRDPGGNGNVNLQVQTVTPLDDGTLIENTAHVYDANAGGVDEDIWVTLVGSGHAFNLSKTGAPDPVEADGLLNYTIEYEVVGNETAQGVVITDRVPLSTTVNWIGDSGVQVGDVISWSLGNLAPGAFGSVHFRVRVDTPLPNGAHIYNTAVISDANDGYAGASEDTTVHADHTLQVSKSDDPDPVQANSLLTYTIHYRVMGNEPAPNVVILDDLPADTSFVDAPGGAFDGDTARWELGGLVPGDEGDVVMVVRTDELLPDSTFIFNQASISDDDGAFVTSLVQRTTLQSTHELHLDKYDTADPVGAGQELIYTIAYTATGQETAAGVTIHDNIPGNTSYVSCVGGTVCSIAGNRVTWFIGDVLPGESGAVTLTLQVHSPLANGTVIHNEAIVSDDNGGVPVTADEDTTVSSWHDLSIIKNDLADPVQAGGLLTYTLDYEVLGNQAAPSVVITDCLPDNAAFQSATGVYDGPNNGVITWTLGELAPGVYGPIEIVVRANTPLPNGTVLTNTAAISDGDGYRAEASEDTTVASAPDLSASTKVVDQSESAPGATLVYTITLVNTGNAVADSASVTDSIPANTVYVGGSATGGATYDPAGDRILWNGTVPVGTPVILTYAVLVDTPLDNGTAIVNQAQVDDGMHAPFETPEALTTISSEPNLLAATTKVVNRATAEPGDTLVYTITLVNSGDMNTYASVEDGLPNHVTYVPGSVSGGATYNEFENRIEWSGLVTTAEPQIIAYAVVIDSPLDGGTWIINRAYVDDGFHSPFWTDPAETEVVAAPVLTSSTKLVNAGSGLPGASAAPGEILRYTLRLVNEGKMNAQAVNVLDELPDEVIYVGGPYEGGSYNPVLRAIIWNGDLNANSVITLTYDVVVDSPMDDGTVITNAATLNYQGAMVLGPVSTTVHSAPDLTGSTKQVDREMALPGELLEYTIRLVNDGNMNAGNVMVTDTLPVSATYEGDLWWSQGAAVHANGVITWEGPVATGPENAVEITYKVRLIDALDDGNVIINVATVDDGFAAHTSFEVGPAETLIARSLMVEIDDGRDTVVPGEFLTYTLTFLGQDPVPGGGELSAWVPTHTQFYMATGVYDILDSGDVKWYLGPLDSNFNDSVLLVVQVDPALPDGILIENDVTFTGNNENVQDDDETIVTSSPDLSNSVKQASADTVYGGDTLVYTIILDNSGTMNADTVVMTDTIPEYTNYVAGSVSGGSYDPVAQAITWAGPLNVGDQVTITFSVVITELDFIPGDVSYFSNVATVDDGYEGHEALAVEAETYLFNGARPDRYKVYLPLVFRSHVPTIDLPDLVVTDITVTPAEPSAGQEVDIMVTIENQGTRAPDSCFWIDLYINPTDLPIQVNMGWFDAGSEAGLVWSLCELNPGESVTLTIDDAREDYSRFAGSFGAPGVQTLYAQVDSWNPGVDYGAVYESNEQNNVYGPHQVTVTGAGGAVGADGVRATSEPPPPRPNTPSH